MRCQHFYRRRAVAVVWFAIMAPMLLLMLILAVDRSHMGRAIRELHNTADASSLAGALFVRQDQDMARFKAREIAELSDVFHSPIDLNLNEGNDPAGDIVLGIWDRNSRKLGLCGGAGQPGCFTPDTTAPNAVEVRARRDDEHNNALPLFLTPSVQPFNTSQIARRAIAMSAGGTGAGIIVLDPSSDCAFRINGNIDLVLIACTAAEEEGGEFGCEAAAENGEAAIQVDSDSDCAACADGTAVHVEAPALNIVGEDPGLCLSGSPDLDIPEINTEVPYIPDPLAGVPEPAVPGTNLGRIRNNSGWFPPGYYAGGIRQNSGGTNLCLGPQAFPCPPPPGFEPDFSTDEPAIYYLEGDGLTYTGGNLYAYQVMFFVHRGPTKLTGNGELIVEPADIDLGGQYGGISIFQARDNATDSSILGTNNMTLKGTYYFPAAELELGGTGIAVGNQLISWQLWIHGTGEWTINYDGRNPAPGTEVFLVY